MKVGITLGDPGGIGPEVVLKACQKLLNSQGEANQQPTLVLYGPQWVFDQPSLKPFSSSLRVISQAKEALPNCLNLIPIDYNGPPHIGQPNAENGKASFKALQAAILDVQANHAQTLVTGPISKESWALGGIPHKDHTSFLQHTSGCEVRMGFYTPSFLVVLDSVHVPLKEACAALNTVHLTQTIQMAHAFGQQNGFKKPRIAVAGLNPHAGENGLIGHEETLHVKPAIQQVQHEGLCVSGPYPPDTVFLLAQHKQADIVVALTHDQGLIAVKLLHFEDAVNSTLGLPFVRTSPDHGTAFDIAYQNKANPRSMIAAIALGIKLPD